jgi:hypothetical protein
MLNHFKHWVCDVPATAAAVLSTAATHWVDQFSVEDAKYLRLVVSSAA